MDKFLIDKSRTVCFSGHRPEGLPDRGDNNSYVVKIIKSMLYKEIIDSINGGYNCFITGLARGVDLWAGEMVLEIKSQNSSIKLVAAAPYKGHGDRMRGIEKWQFGNIIHKADSVVYVSEEYHRSCMQKRNEYMIDNSDKLIAMISDYKSGTGQTVRYAKSKGIHTKIFDLNRIADTYDQVSINN